MKDESTSLSTSQETKPANESIREAVGEITHHDTEWRRGVRVTEDVDRGRADDASLSRTMKQMYHQYQAAH